MAVFVKLTMFTSGEEVVANLSNVVVILPAEARDGCTLRFLDGWKLAVRETLEDICKLANSYIINFGGDQDGDLDR